MALHWHAYSFNLAGGDITDAKGRDDLDGFRNLEHPASRLSAYLKKSPSMIRGTFTDPDEALKWFLSQYEALPRLLTPDRDEDGVPYLGLPNDPERLAENKRYLLNGNDLAWSFWVINVRRHDYRLICCPHPTAPEIPCPQRPAMAG